MRQSMIVKNINTIKYPFEILDGMEVLANVRYRGKTVLGSITVIDNDTIRIDFQHQVRAITAGQSSVFYDPKAPNDVIGGGHIYEVLKSK
jgi:tRNA U34 2-thiouridine synthase MnmA/TrmU